MLAAWGLCDPFFKVCFYVLHWAQPSPNFLKYALTFLLPGLVACLPVLLKVFAALHNDLVRTDRWRYKKLDQSQYHLMFLLSSLTLFSFIYCITMQYLLCPLLITSFSLSYLSNQVQLFALHQHSVAQPPILLQLSPFPLSFLPWGKLSEWGWIFTYHMEITQMFHIHCLGDKICVTVTNPSQSTFRL